MRPCGRAPRMPRHCISTRCRGQRPVAYRAHASVKPVPSLRACGARPSAGGQTQRGLPSGLGLGNDGKSDFLGGTHSVRPCGTAVRMPGHFVPTPSVGERPVAYRAHASVKLVPSLWACGARPSAGRAIQGKRALRGKPGDNAKGVFLGGTHSVRPHGKAPRMPRHSIFTRR